ncbi:hypothetical protein [Streptomyces sannanensis]|uniref:hypothetical protein n=1 Tax=Streptomyces sannanensis TaxID=285536 RepID=UPI0031E9216B
MTTSDAARCLRVTKNRLVAASPPAAVLEPFGVKAATGIPKAPLDRDRPNHTIRRLPALLFM